MAGDERAVELAHALPLFLNDPYIYCAIGSRHQVRQDAVVTIAVNPVEPSRSTSANNPNMGALGKSKLGGKEEDIRMLLGKEVSKASIAKILDVSRSALYHFIETRKIGPG